MGMGVRHVWPITGLFGFSLEVLPFSFWKKRCSFPTNHITRPLLLNHVLIPFQSPLNLLLAAIERGNHMKTITEVVNTPPPSCGGWVLQANSTWCTSSYRELRAKLRKFTSRYQLDFPNWLPSTTRWTSSIFDADAPVSHLMGLKPKFKVCLGMNFVFV